MASDGRGAKKTTFGASHNTSIIAEREQTTRSGLERKKEQIIAVTKQIKKLNKDNIRKDEEIKNIDQ